MSTLGWPPPRLVTMPRSPWILVTLLAACSAPVALFSPHAAEADADAASYAARQVILDRRAAEANAGLQVIPGSPEAARQWRMLRWQDENGVYDPSLLLAARAQRDANAEFHDGQDVAGIGRFGWVERGPRNIGGRTRSLVINPANPNELFAGAVGGGIWRSLDAGVSWREVDDRLGNLAVCSLCFVPGSPAVIYAGTGEGFYNGDAIRGSGIYKSSDGGNSFQRLPSTANWHYVNRIAVSPSNPNLLLAAVRSPGGIYRSTNGGSSWTQVRSGTACMQVLFDPNDSNRCVADIFENDQHRVVWSSNAGQTWTNASSGLVGQQGISGRIELCYAQSVPGMVYASCGTGGGLIWRSTDHGANWQQRTASGGGSGASWYYNTLWVDPTDADILVTGAYHLYRSVDGGASLVRISNGYINTTQPHPDQHQIVADPGYDGVSNRRVYITNDGGVYTTSNIRTATTSSGWARRDQGYRSTQFYGAAGDGATGRITGGTQDNGHLTIQNGSSSASLTFGGDGGFAAIDWVNPSYIYGEYIYARVHRSTNGGTSASYIDGGISEAGNAANFIAPLILDPNNPQRLLVGAASLWRTNNARASSVSWSAIKPSIGSNISAIAVARGNPDVIWVGHNNGQVWRTANGTAASPTWIAVDNNGSANPLPNRYIERIVIDHGDANTVWVSLGGFNAGNLQKTTDAGATFQVMTGSGVTGLPNAPINGVAQHPVLRDHLYVGTEVGVFASEDGGLTWSTSNEGPADVAVDEVVFMHNSTTLLAATHGRGLWTCAIRLPTVTPIGAGCPGTMGVPSLTATAPKPGQSVLFSCSNLRPGQFGWTVFGYSATSWNGAPLPQDLASFGMPGCLVHCSVDLGLTGINPFGTLVTSLPLAADPATLGTTFYAQAVSLDAGVNALGAVVSNGLALTIGN
jgi:hypothetical protein